MTNLQQDALARPPPNVVDGVEHGEHTPRTLPEAMNRARWIVGQALAEKDGKSSGRPIVNDAIDKMPGAEPPSDSKVESDALLDEDDAPAERHADVFAESDREIAQRKSHVRREA